jgi:hypothetical protein
LPPSGRQGPTVQAAPLAVEDSWIEDISEPAFHAGQLDHGPSVIVKDDNSSVGNIFCFAAFADKRTGVLYNDLTGSFPYMSLEGNVCYLIYTTTNPMQYSVSQYPVLMTSLYLQRTKHSSNFWKAKDTR